MEKRYSINIYTAGGDTARAWYIRWYLRNPKTGLLERQTNVKLGCNRLKTADERLAFLKRVKRYMAENLNSKDFIDDLNLKFNEKDERKSLKEAFAYFEKIRKPAIAEDTFGFYKYIFDLFCKYLKTHTVLDKNSNVKKIRRQMIVDFLGKRLKETSATTRNNAQRSLHAIWEFFKNEGFAERNIVSGIIVLFFS